MEVGTRNVAEKHGTATGIVPLLLLVVVGVASGITNNVSKVGGQYGVPLLPLLFWGMLGGAILLGIVAVLSKSRPPINRTTIIYGLLSGLLLIALPTSIIYLAAKPVGAGFVSLSLAFVPMITYLWALGLSIETFRWVRVAGVIAGLAGGLVLALGKARAPDSEIGWILATAAIPMIIASGNIYRNQYWPKGAAPLSLAPLMLAGGAVWLLPVALYFGIDSTGTTAGIGLAVLQAVVSTTMYSLYFVVQRMSGTVYLSQLGSIGAISGAAIAILVFGEAPPQGLALAAMLIVIGIVLFSVKKKAA
jgi:drug/metabolite transporter (DMT)-like permease